MTPQAQTLTSVEASNFQLIRPPRRGYQKGPWIRTFEALAPSLNGGCLWLKDTGALVPCCGGAPRRQRWGHPGDTGVNHSYSVPRRAPPCSPDGDHPCRFGLPCPPSSHPRGSQIELRLVQSNLFKHKPQTRAGSSIPRQSTKLSHLTAPSTLLLWGTPTPPN